MRVVATTCLSLVVSCWAYPQQRSTLPTGVTGFVSRVAFLEVEQQKTGAAITTQIIAQSRNAATIRLSSATSGRVVLRLLLRSNTRYELQAALLSSSASLIMTASVESANPTGSGVRVGAVEMMKRIATAAPLSATRLTLATGPPISAGGSARSPSNAIEIEINLEADAVGEWWAETQFSLKTS